MVALSGLETGLEGKSLSDLPHELIAVLPKEGKRGIPLRMKLGEPDAVEEAIRELVEAKSDVKLRMRILEAFAGTGIPLFGVCLGHQCVGQYFGGKVIRADRLMHGKTSPIKHTGQGLFKDLPPLFKATRYHSLLVEKSSFPDCLEITAETAEGEIMGLQHRDLPIHGVQFHPESMATENGMQLLRNFLDVGSPGNP